jgi:hypothetical protein
MSTGALAVVAILVVLLAAAAAVAVIRRRRADTADPPSWETEPRPSLFDAAPAAGTNPLESGGGGTAANPEDLPHERVTAPAAPHATVQQTEADVELRVRGLLLLNLPLSAGLEDIERAPPLGTRDEVLDRLREMLPGLEFTDAGRGHVLGPDHEVRIDIGTADPTPTAVAAASGTRGIDMLYRLLVRTGWRAYAARTGSFLSADDPPRADEQSLQER